MRPSSRTLARLQELRPPALLVSLPANDPQLAEAALAGGADGLKTHIYVSHRAAGITFGSLAEEEAALQAIVALGAPVGIVPGDHQRMATREEILRLRELGIDYLDVYLDAMPAWLLQQAALPVMGALGPQDLRLEGRLAAAARLPGIEMFEASIVEPAGYGQPLSAADLCDYTEIVCVLGREGKPVIVPTQRAIEPEEAVLLAEIGVRGLLLGAIVTGKEARGLEQVVRRYREALG